MTDNYTKLVQNNLALLYSDLPDDLANLLPAEQNGRDFSFSAFGDLCTITPEKIDLPGSVHNAIKSILISLYAINAKPDICIPTPFKAFKEFPDSTPYVGAFTTHTEQVLVPHVDTIKGKTPDIIRILNGMPSPEGTAGDFSFMIFPLPKVALCYIFYEADDDFPASVTCLYSNNANLFLPMDGLADVGEYSSKKILEIIG